MTDTKLYKVAITPCGKYVHGTEYDALCLVLNATEDGGDGCAYISKKPNKNIRPGTDSSVWALSMERGEQGQQGPSGAGFSYVDIIVSGEGETPSGSASISDDTLHLEFSGISGAPGPAGPTGETGPIGPTGPKGDKGDKGDQGNSGVVLDGVTEENFVADMLVNNVVDGGATKALTAQMGVYLYSLILANASSLYDVNDDGLFIVDEQLNIGVKINSSGVFAQNILNYEFVED